jgi:glycosyltransferase involved in cell wall biosynthesis
MTNPGISVIIPVYNRAWCVAEALRSVLDQDFSGFEIIAVDDGSTDQTPEILASFSGIRVIRTGNRGVSAARNTGVAHAKGRLVAFLDSDDLWLPKKLSRQIAYMNEHPCCRICQTEETWIRNGIRVNPKRRHKKPDGDIFPRSLDLCLVSPSAVMMEKSLFEESGGFDESLPACEDYDLWLRIGLTHKVPLIPDALVIKRGGHEDQLSRKPCLDMYRVRSLDKLLGCGLLTFEQAEAVKRRLDDYPQ